jgi:hypothetical protein
MSLLGCADAAAVPVVAAADWSAEAFYEEFIVSARPVVRCERRRPLPAALPAPPLPPAPTLLAPTAAAAP